MKIGLISPDNVYSLGIRHLSAYLKYHGHETISLFLVGDNIVERSKEKIFSSRIKPDDLIKLFKDCDVIGMSCLSFNTYEIIHMVKILSSLSKPIVWGGIQATLCPEFCIEYVDIVCIGEGEIAFLDLINKIQNGEDIYNTQNFWFKKNNKIIKNPPRPLIEDLDTLPTPDYDFKDKYVFNGKEIVPLRPEKHMYYINILTTFGCPYKCTYCSSPTLGKIFSNNGKGGKYLRKKSVSKIINDLEKILKEFNNPSYIEFDDDLFFIRSFKELKEFSKEYKKRINIPFFMFVSPNKMNEKKLNLLIETGLIEIEMGIQSGSNRINKEIFKRKIRNEHVIKAVTIINKVIHSSAKNFIPRYDIIIDNPYEDKNDTLETLKLITSLPKPFILEVFSLQFFPKTELSCRAIKDSLIEPESILPKMKNYFLRDITKEIITINDVISLMCQTNTEERYGLIKSKLIKDFLIDEASIHKSLKVIIDPSLIKFVDRESDEVKRDLFKYIIRVIAFLRQKYHEIKEDESTKYIETNPDDYGIIFSTLSRIFIHKSHFVPHIYDSRTFPIGVCKI